MSNSNANMAIILCLLIYAHATKALELVQSFSARSVGSLNMSPVGFGCWQYGNKFLWNYDEANDDELKRVFEYSCGIRNIWFDTAEVYGKDHRSENLLGKFLSSSRHGDRRPQLLTKCAPQILKIGKESLISSGEKSLSRLGTDVIDLYQLHWPPTPALWQEKEYIQGLVKIFIVCSKFMNNPFFT